MEVVTEDQRIAVLVYAEDHPDQYTPEISEATGVNFRDVKQILREFESPRYRIRLKNENLTLHEAIDLSALLHAHDHDCEIEDMTPCAHRVHHGPGHQSETYCEKKGHHEHHGAQIMGMWEEWDDEGNEI